MLNIYLFLLLWLLSFNCRSQSLTVENTPDGVWVKEEGEKVLFYQAKTKSKDGKYPRANYIHPLYGPDGFELTEDFPEDHLHHRGIFWAWHQVIIGNKPIGDAWECRDFQWQVEKINHDRKNDLLSLNIKTLWKSLLWTNDNGIQEPFLSENTKITVHPAADNYRIIDFEIALLALVPDLKIGGSNDKKGYGGFSVRMKTPEDISFTSQHGEVIPEIAAVSAGSWMNISGSLANDGGKGGIVIMNHPNNPTHPDPWILREKESMQNSVYPGRYPVPVSDEEATVLRYRLVVYRGDMPELNVWEE